MVPHLVIIATQGRVPPFLFLVDFSPQKYKNSIFRLRTYGILVRIQVFARNTRPFGGFGVQSTPNAKTDVPRSNYRCSTFKFHTSKYNICTKYSLFQATLMGAPGIISSSYYRWRYFCIFVSPHVKLLAQKSWAVPSLDCCTLHMHLHPPPFSLTRGTQLFRFQRSHSGMNSCVDQNRAQPL